MTKDLVTQDGANNEQQFQITEQGWGHEFFIKCIRAVAFKQYLSIGYPVCLLTLKFLYLRSTKGAPCKRDFQKVEFLTSNQYILRDKYGCDLLEQGEC